MYIVFYSTNNVFKAEEIFCKKKVGCKVVPTPVKDKAYCGVCLETDYADARELLTGIEFEIID